MMIEQTFLSSQGNEARLLVINWCIRVASRVAEQLKTYQENLKIL